MSFTLELLAQRGLEPALVDVMLDSYPDAHVRAKLVAQLASIVRA